MFGNKVGGYEQAPGASPVARVARSTPTRTCGSPPTRPAGRPTASASTPTYPGYEPNYTKALYAKGYDTLDANNQPIAPAVNPDKGMSGWCAGCHATYNGRNGSEDSTYNAGDGGGFKKRHRHPMNVPLSNYTQDDWGGNSSMIVTDMPLPLDHDLGEGTTATNTESDWLECLTCHRAHGTGAKMSGWADEYAADPSDDIADFVSRSGSGDPSALLRLDNRGVCEVCHNK